MPSLALPAPDFELLFAALPTPFVALAPDGTILALNTAMTTLLGQAADLAGRPLAALHTALAAAGHALPSAEAWAAGVQAAQASPQAQVLTPEWPGEAGPEADDAPGPTYWETTLQPVRTPAAPGQPLGELRYLLVRLLDVSAQLRTAHHDGQLQHQQLHMQRILDQLPLTITTMEGPDLAFTFLSAQARANMGDRVRVGQTVAETLPEITAQGYLQLLEQVRTSGQPHFGHEEKTEMLDPATGQLEVRYHNYGYLPLQGEQSRGVLAYGFDVTEQVQARLRNEALQAEAQAANLRLRRVTESLPTITFITDQDRKVLYVSPQWFAYTGTTPEELDREWMARLHPDDVPHALEQYETSLATGTPWRYELRLRRHDGEYRWFMSQGVPEPLEEAQAAGRPRLWFGSDLDIHDLRDSQRLLEAKDRQLSQILSQSPAMIATVGGPDHRFTFTNAAYDELVGGRARLGEPAAKCLPEIAQQGFMMLLESVYESGKPFVGRAMPLDVLDAASGQTRQMYLDFTYQPLYDDHGQTNGILTFGVDVTQQVLARQETEVLQAEVRAADLRLRRQAEVLPIITFTTDAKGRTTYMSPQWYAFTGQKAGGDWEEVDTVWAERIHPDDRERSRFEIQQSINFSRLGRVEVRLRGANGQYRWFLTEAVPEFDAGGRLRLRYGFLLDVHELRETQRRLEDKDRQLSQILEQVPALLATSDGPQHRFTFFNSHFSQMLGHRMLLGLPFAEALPELVEQGFVALLDRVYRTGETYVGKEVQVYLSAAGTAEPAEQYFDFTYIALRDWHGKITGTLTFALNVTERVRNRQQAEELAAEINRRDEQVRTITASVPVFIFNFNPGGHITYTNPYFYEYTGLDPTAPPDDNWNVLPPAHLDTVRALAQTAMAAGEPWQATFQCRRRDGELRWFQTKAQPYTDAEGKLAGFSAATVKIHELHERTEELARSRADFAALADNIAQLAWMADATGYIFWYNQQWYDYTGSTFEDMQGWGWKKVHDPALVEGVNERYVASIKSGQPWEDTFPLRGHDGQYRWFLSRARPIRDPDSGEVVRWFGTNTDVTELRQLQTQLSDSEEELRIQAESIPQQVWTAQPDGTMDFFNHRTAAYVGQAVRTNGPILWQHYVHPDDRAPMQARWEQAIASQRYYEAEFRLRRYDGEYRWFLGQAQARRAPGGQVLRWYGTNTDVHQQRMLQAELVRREEQFRFLAESVPQIVWTSTGVNGNDYINQRWYDYTGLEPSDTGNPANWPAVIHPDDLNMTNRRWQHSVATGEFFEIEYRFRRHDGVYRWFLGQGRAQRGADGSIIKWFGTCTDIDDQKRVQEQLEAQNARLVRTNEDLDNFVYTASHDLKQPINNMAGIFEELTRTAYFRDPDAIKLISYFERALAQIFGTIDDLSAIVRGQRQQQEAPAEEITLQPLVEEVIGSLQDLVTQTGAKFEFDFATYPVVTFVRPNLQSLFFNLISNSLKYAAPGRPPLIRLSSTPDALTGRPTITVQDNGLGIDMERFGPQLFQLFRRFHTHAEGTGMGLYLVNRIVQNHGGRIEVSSTVGEGTTFCIYL